MLDCWAASESESSNKICQPNLTLAISRPTIRLPLHGKAKQSKAEERRVGDERSRNRPAALLLLATDGGVVRARETRGPVTAQVGAASVSG
uniref:Uncharacterized protein n=1 Tax=Oryza barthii TaxID=65489 RepID=A0A0D3EL63_9ORYZ